VIIAIGIDVVLVDRFTAALVRTPLLADRLFTESERLTASGNPRSPESLAARFAAKEAVMKALGVGLGAFAFHDVEVLSLGSGAPDLRVTGAAARLAGERGVASWTISLTHSVMTAGAVVTAT